VFSQNISDAIATIFRMILLQKYKVTNMVSCVAISPYQFKIIIISVKIIQVI